jgi:hypothetical protein
VTFDGRARAFAGDDLEGAPDCVQAVGHPLHPRPVARLRRIAREDATNALGPKGAPMPSISRLIALSGLRIARMYPMIGNRQKLRRKARSVSTFPASMIENQMPPAMPRIVRPKMTRASSRRRGELTGPVGSSIELDMAAWCHVRRPFR